MAGSVNKAIIVGNVGRDPEVKSTNDGREIATLTVATSESWRNKASGEKKERTEWHRVVVFNGGLVNVIKNYIKKGSKIYIEGALHTRKWTDKDGVERYTTEIVLQGFGGVIIMLSGSGGSNGEKSVDQPQQSSPGNSESIDDEVPF